MDRPLSFSFSRLNSYSKCPFYFLKVNVEKVAIAEAPILTTGSVIHEILKNYTLKCYEQKKTHLFDQWEDIALNTMQGLAVDLEYEKEILDAVKLYVEANEIELEGLAGVEERISIAKDLSVCDWDSAWFRGIIDKLYIMDTNCKISDYKTGFNLKPDPFQFEIYVWLVSLLYPHIDFFQVELDFTRFNSKKIWTVKKEDIPTIKKRVLSRCKQIEADTEFKPRVTSLCEDCPLWSICPAIKNIDSLGMSRVPQAKKEASELLKNIITRKKELKELKDVLKQYVEKKGDVCHEDMMATFKAIVSKEYDVRGMIAWANKEGKDILDLFNVDSRKATKFKIPKDFYVENVEARFSIKSNKS